MFNSRVSDSPEARDYYLCKDYQHLNVIFEISLYYQEYFNTSCCVFVLIFFVCCTLCCQFLWIVDLWLPLRYSLTFI